MLKLNFTQGNLADATRMLNDGKHVIITDELHQLRHLDVGRRWC